MRDLDKVHIGAVVEEITDNVTEEIHLPRAVGEAEDPLVLGTEGDEVPHLGLRAPLGHRPQELAALGGVFSHLKSAAMLSCSCSHLGEADGVVAALKLWVISQHLTHLAHLPVRWNKCESDKSYIF